MRKLIGSDWFVMAVLAAFGLVMFVSIDWTPAEFQPGSIVAASHGEGRPRKELRELFGRVGELPRRDRPAAVAAALKDPQWTADEVKLITASWWLYQLPEPPPFPTPRAE